MTQQHPYELYSSGIGSSFTDGWKSTNWVCAAIITYVVYITAFVSDVAFGMAPSEQMRSVYYFDIVFSTHDSPKKLMSFNNSPNIV